MYEARQNKDAKTRNVRHVYLHNTSANRHFQQSNADRYTFIDKRERPQAASIMVPIQMWPKWKYFNYIQTPLKTLVDFSFSMQNLKDVLDVRRWRLNPLNIIGGYRNFEEEQFYNYHSSARHGAHNTLKNAKNRLSGNMINIYDGKKLDLVTAQSRFNSEAWESFSWRKAKEEFNTRAGNVRWKNDNSKEGSFKTWRVKLHMKGIFNLNIGNDVGVSLNDFTPLSDVLVAINYKDLGGGWYLAWDGQMFPVSEHKTIKKGNSGLSDDGGTIDISHDFLGF